MKLHVFEMLGDLNSFVCNINSNQNCLLQIIQTVPAEELAAWVSSATTEDIYQQAANFDINERIRFIVREEMYKSVKPSDSGKI